MALLLSARDRSEVTYLHNNYLNAQINLSLFELQLVTRRLGRLRKFFTLDHVTRGGR